MIELPEANVLSRQIDETLKGKTIKRAVAGAFPHAFAWYTGDPATYGAMLDGKKVTGAGDASGSGKSCGGNVRVRCENMELVISTPIKYHAPGEKLPKKHQLLLEFADGSHMSCTVQMWGAMFCVPHDPSKESLAPLPCPLADGFDRAYFDGLLSASKADLSAKAFLATEQRIPGLGNGVLHDILFNARIHPKRKLCTLEGREIKILFESVKETLKRMTDEGGRDTEKDLFGNKGGYATILSNNTLGLPCRVCGGALKREAYLGGNIYFCPACQPV